MTEKEYKDAVAKIIERLFTKDEVVAMLTELQLEIEKNSYPENVYGDEYGINEIIPTDGVYQIIQQKIDKLRGDENEQ